MHSLNQQCNVPSNEYICLEGFWAHEDSPLIHPVGWAKRVGQTLAAPPLYVDRCLKGLRDKDDATEDLFPLHNSMGYHTGFQRGMKLEAVDPLNLSSICVATVMKVKCLGCRFLSLLIYIYINRYLTRLNSKQLLLSIRCFLTLN
jgi:hypothetical protein